jgi:hypothetical protein
VLAQALEGSRRGDATRVRTLVMDARADLAALPIVNAPELAQIDAWVAAHSPKAP